MICPICDARHDRETDQGISVMLFGECVSCRFLPHGCGSGAGTEHDLEAIDRRRTEMRMRQQRDASGCVA